MMTYSLADFYKSEKISISSPEITLRESSIEAMDNEIDLNMANALIDLIYNDKSLPSDIVVNVFKENDKTFSSIDNRREISLLASYIVFVKHPSDLKLHLSCITASLNGSIQSQCCVFLNDSLEESLHEINIKMREDVPLPGITLTYPDEDFQGLEFSEDEDNEAEEFELDNIGDVIKEQRHYFSVFAKKINQSINHLNDNFNSLKEESNFFWWIMRAYSDSHEKKFADLDNIDLMLASARELAALTTTSLGPTSIEKIILRASEASGLKNESNVFSFKDLIERCPEVFTPDDEVKSIVNKRYNCFPIIFALLKKDEIGSGLVWCKKFDEKYNGISKVNISPINFSVGLYRELLLINLIKS